MVPSFTSVNLLVIGVLTIFSVFFLYTGFSSFARPKKFAQALSLKTIGASGEVEIRAQYGSFFFVLGLLQSAAIFDFIDAGVIFFFDLIVFGSLVLGRLMALPLKPRQAKLTQMIRNLYWIDGLGAAMSLIGVCLIYGVR